MTEPLAAFSTSRLFVVAPAPAHRAALEAGAGPWRNRLDRDVFDPRPSGHHAWIPLVRGEPAGAIVAFSDGEELHVDGFVVSSLRGLGLATEALGGLADQVLVSPGHVPVSDASSPTRHRSPTRIVLHPADVGGARVAERAGAIRDGERWVLDLVGHTGLDRGTAIDGRRIARLIASLRPEDGAAIEAEARARFAEVVAARAAARDAARRVVPRSRHADVRALVERPATVPAVEADVREACELCAAEKRSELAALLGRRLFTNAQLDSLRLSIDDTYLSPREQSDGYADLREWIADYERTRAG